MNLNLMSTMITESAPKPESPENALLDLPTTAVATPVLPSLDMAPVFNPLDLFK